MKARQYAEALYRAAHAHHSVDVDVLVTRLVAVVRERGHLRLLPAIVREYDTLMRMRSTTDEVHVRVARESDHAKHTARIEQDIAMLNASGRPVRTIVDDTVIGGYALETNGTRVDRTYKQALLELYSSLITKA
jgi:F0F1-type ATP synthase delta subunit